MMDNFELAPTNSCPWFVRLVVHVVHSLYVWLVVHVVDGTCGWCSKNMEPVGTFLGETWPLAYTC